MENTTGFHANVNGQDASATGFSGAPWELSADTKIELGSEFVDNVIGGGCAKEDALATIERLLGENAGPSGSEQLLFDFQGCAMCCN